MPEYFLFIYFCYNTLYIIMPNLMGGQGTREIHTLTQTQRHIHADTKTHTQTKTQLHIYKDTHSQRQNNRDIQALIHSL